MTLNEYQKLAARTINKDLKSDEQELHALHGMVGEIGELHSLYQKLFQGHDMDEKHAMKELGDLLWFVAEFCTSKGWALDEVAMKNICKLVERYPEGFETEKSLFRKPGDV